LAQGISNSATLWGAVMILSTGSITFIALVLALGFEWGEVMLVAG